MARRKPRVTVVSAVGPPTGSDVRPPDLMEAAIGWRSWSFAKEPPLFGTAVKLYSVTHGNYYWAPRRRSRAECGRCGPDIPGENCSCGFYSARTLRHLLQMSYHLYNEEESGWFHAVGQVANWGKVIECETGWRSEYSYPRKLYIPYEAAELAKLLHQSYGVPVRLMNFLKQPTEMEF